MAAALLSCALSSRLQLAGRGAIRRSDRASRASQTNDVDLARFQWSSHKAKRPKHSHGTRRCGKSPRRYNSSLHLLAPPSRRNTLSASTCEPHLSLARDPAEPVQRGLAGVVMFFFEQLDELASGPMTKIAVRRHSANFRAFKQGSKRAAACCARSAISSVGI